MSRGVETRAELCRQWDCKGFNGDGSDTAKIPHGEPHAGKPHVAPSLCYGVTGRFDEEGLPQKNGECITFGVREMKRCCLLLSLVAFSTSYSCADEAIAHQEAQTNSAKTTSVIYVPRVKIKVRAKMDRIKDKVKRKTKDIKSETKDKIRRKLFMPQATTNYNQAVVK